ncbi:MAG: chorismate synthase [Vicingaceae bacterium]|nr:MAG: chorismate synthase [Vicingaceae bacterium]
MNQLGRLFQVTIFGESHGPHVGIVINGVPPGIDLSPEDFHEDIRRRQPGKPGTTPRIEKDIPKLISGVYNGKTTGMPLTILFDNENTRSKDYEIFKSWPRPGHADYTASQKYLGFNDPRGGGHFSGRLTLPLTAAGVVAKKVIPFMDIHATVIEIAGEKDIEKGLQKALEKNDSVGGIVECIVKNIPAGLGEPFFDSLESTIAHAVFSIPAIKGIEFGSGFAAARMFGSEHNDPVIDDKGTTATNHSGGINGGISNGNPLVFRVAVKPTSSTPQEQKSWNFNTKTIETLKIEGRHDLCIALRVPVVVEAVTAIVLADHWLVQKSRIHGR